MSTRRPFSPKLAEIAKYPVTYVLVAVVSLLWFFVRYGTGESAGRTADCKEEKIQLRSRIAVLESALDKERAANDTLSADLLKAYRVIDGVPRIVDSVMRNR